MSLALVPVVFLSVFIILSQVDEPVTMPKEGESVLGKHIYSRQNSKNDEETIYNYIRQTFKKISNVDAKRISENLVNYGKKYRVDPKFAAAVIARESGFKKDAVSKTGAKGLGQIKDFNFKDLNINDPYKIDQNVSGTVQYMKKMIKKWQKEPQYKTKKNEQRLTDEHKIKLALASYYKGFTAVKTEGVDKKTSQYVDDIVAYYKDILRSQR